MMPSGERLRHRRTPERILGDELIVAGLRDGLPIELEHTAALIWRQLDEWTTVEEIDHRLAEQFPDISQEERVAARVDVLLSLIHI